MTTTITLLDNGSDRYTQERDSKYFGRKWDNIAEAVKVLFPEVELEANSACYMIVVHENAQIDSILVGNNVPFDVTNVLSRHDRIKVGFSFQRPDGYVKNSEWQYYYFHDALKPEDYVPVDPEQEQQFNLLLGYAFTNVDWKAGTRNVLEFKNMAGGVVKEIELSPFVQEQADLAEQDPDAETYVKHKSTIYLANEGSNGTSPYAEIKDLPTATSGLTNDGDGTSPFATEADLAGVSDSIGNGTITITQGGQSKGTFTVNQKGDTTIEIDDGETDYEALNNLPQVNGVTLIGNKTTQDLKITTYQPFQNTWRTNGTFAQFMQDVENDSTAVKGMVYLGELTCSDLPFMGNADAVVEIIDGTGNQKVIVTSINSGTDSPYYWRYTYWVIGGMVHTSGWKSFVPSDRKINGKSLTSDVNLTAGDVGALPDSTVIPTVNNARITINQGSTTKGSFTLNQSADLTITLDAGGGGGGTGNYPDLTNKPQINGVTLEGNLSSSDLSLATSAQGSLADTALQPSDVDSALSDSSENPVQNKVLAVLIPSDASDENPLTTYNFVNSSINNMAAFYITRNANGDPFQTKAQLDATSTYYSGGEVRVPTKNDYCIVIADITQADAVSGYASFTTTAQYVGYHIIYDNTDTLVTVDNKDSIGITAGTTPCYYSIPTTRYTYQGSQWEFQYIVNKTSLTAAQIAAINSGITSSLVAQISTNQGNISTLDSTKLNKVTTANQMYATDGSGNQITYTVSQTENSGTIVRRDTGGVIFTGTPTNDRHATTKKYVDDSITRVTFVRWA